MMKIIFTAFVAAAVGIAAGIVAMHGTLAPRLSEALTERDAGQQERDRLAHQLEATTAKLQHLERQNAEYAEAIDRLGENAAQPAPARMAPPPPQERPRLDEAFDARAAWGANEAGVEEQQAETEGESPERRRERAERRQEWSQRMRGGIQGYLGDQIAQTSEPAARERLEAMAEYSDYLFDLRGQMAEAETDEERKALRETMRTAGGEAYGLVQEQRQYMLRQAAAAAGISEPAKQEALAQTVQETLRSPLFRLESMMGGGRGGDRGGGPPRPPGEGRRPR